MNTLVVQIADAVPVNGWFNATAVRLIVAEGGVPAFIEGTPLWVCRLPGKDADAELTAGRFYQAVELATPHGIRAAIVL